MSVSVELYSDMQNNIILTKSRNIIIASPRATCMHRMYRGNIAELFLTFESNIITTLVDFYSILQTFIRLCRFLVLKLWQISIVIDPRGLDSLWDYGLDPKALCTMREFGSLKRVSYCSILQIFIIFVDFYSVGRTAGFDVPKLAQIHLRNLVGKTIISASMMIDELIFSIQLSQTKPGIAFLIQFYVDFYY